MLPLKVTVLGSGTSQGIPVIACSCNVCLSSDARDKRLRSSVLISVGDKTIVIDTGPDFRQQMLRENVQRLDAVIFTHEHKDHVAGLDDVRAFNFKQQKDMPVFCNLAVENALKREFSYVFAENTYPGIPRLQLNRIDKDIFEVEGISVVPIEVMHYQMPVLGFRIGNFAYITDAKTISDEEKKKLVGVKVLVVNALRIEPHISHFTLAEALELIDEVKAEKGYLTHISHMLGMHDGVEKSLPEHVKIAYDGLQFTVS